MKMVRAVLFGFLADGLFYIWTRAAEGEHHSRDTLRSRLREMVIRPIFLTAVYLIPEMESCVVSWQIEESLSRTWQELVGLGTTFNCPSSSEQRNRKKRS